MRKMFAGALALGLLAGCQGSVVPLGGLGTYEVYGVAEGDMLKLRGGPGTDFDVRAGLPNGTRLNVRDCQRLGGTRWCEVSAEGASGLEGYVSETYIRAL